MELIFYHNIILGHQDVRHRNSLFYFQIGDETITGQGSLTVDGTQTFVTTTIDDVVSEMTVVEHDGTLHLFSSVSGLEKRY